MILALFWLVIGLLIGALANVAKVRPAVWGPRGWVWLLAIGALAALASGWVATLLVGVQFATVTAVWVTVITVTALPHVGMWIMRMNQRVRSSGSDQ